MNIFSFSDLQLLYLLPFLPNCPFDILEQTFGGLRTSPRVDENQHAKYLGQRSVYTLVGTRKHTRPIALPEPHTHGPFPGLPRSAGTRKVKPIWILLKQETVSGSGISWAICKSAPRSRQITTPAPHHSVLHVGCPSCRPTYCVKALALS